jgi:multidrug efflux pump subunit AcrB
MKPLQRIVDFFINEKLIIYLLVGSISVAGIFAMLNTNKEAFPEVSLNMAVITTIYPGATPDEIENFITIPIEKKMREIDDVKALESFNIENVSVVVVRLEDHLKPEEVKSRVADIKDNVDAINDLPEDAKDPEIAEINTDKMPAIDIAVMTKKNGDKAYSKLRAAAKDLENKLLMIDGIADIQKMGYLDKEYLIEVNPKTLKKYNIGLNTIINRLSAHNLNLPGGSLKIKDKEYIIRTLGQYQNIKGVQDTVIFSNDTDNVTRLKDVATVKDTFEEPESYDRINQKDSIVLRVLKKKDSDTIKTIDRINAFLEDYNKNLSKDITVLAFNDTSEFVRTRLESLFINAAIGFALLLAILFLLIGFRMALIVSITIPISFCIAFLIMKQQGITLNVISMFSLVMVLGMIVDFSIVVAENSYRYIEDRMPIRQAVDKGVSEVISSLTVVMLCIMAAFAPLLFVSGLVGKFIYAIPMVIIICLFSSWVCAIFVIPSVLAQFAKLSSRKQKNIANSQKKISPVMMKYRNFLSFIIDHRYLSTLVLIVIFVLTHMFVGTKLGFVFMPSSGKSIILSATMPQGTNLETTRKAVIKLENIVSSIPETELESTHTKIGDEAERGLDLKPRKGTHRGSIKLNLVPEVERTRSAEQILSDLRLRVKKAKENGTVNNRLTTKFEIEQEGFPVGKAISIEIRGDNLDTSKEIAQKYIDYLNKIEGVSDIELDLEEGKTEYRYTVNEANAMKGGLSIADVATTILTSFKGTVATTIKEGDEEIDLRVRFQEKTRTSKNGLKDVVIANRMGGLIPLHKVASYTEQKGYALIPRKNYSRIVKVNANVDNQSITSIEANKILAEDFADINKQYPNHKVSYAGEQEDTNESMMSLGILFLVALCCIYFVLSAYFSSLITPLVVMVCIPFSLIGVYITLYAHNQPLSFMSVLGLFSLAGVIVSNTLVLVKFINNLREQGMGVKEALVEGGAIRFRPVLLTSGTTVLGLIPTIYGLGGKDEFVAPLGLSFGYGLIFATIITLIMVPCFYHIAEDYKNLLRRVFNKNS